MRLKDLVQINQRTLPENTPGNYSFRYIDIGSVDSSGTIQNMEEMTFENAPSRARRIVQRNDVIVSTVRTYLRAIASIDFDAQDVVASTGFAVCTPKANVIPRYLHYALRCDKVMDEICKESIGISYPAINSTMLSSIDVPYFSIPEQRRIVAYLDEKTAAIDKRVELLEKKREAVARLKKSVINRAVTRGLAPNAKLKDSGVDWMGQVPEDWEVSRIGSIFDLRSTKVSDTDYPPLSVSKKGVVPQMESVAKTGNGDDRKLVKAGDFVINSRSDRRGACGISDRDGSVSVINIVLCPRRKMNPGYYNWLFHTTMFAEEFYNHGKGIVDDLWSTRWSEMKGISIVVPPQAEQAKIADYLDAECAKIDAAVANLDKQTDAYRRLKRSLIDEVVTGKRKVG